MKILMVHNRYLIRGGEDEIFDSESKLLEAHNHEIIKYIQNNKIIQDIPRLKLGIRTIWSQEDYINIKEIIKYKKPDLIYVQNFFPLVSPAVYYAAKQENIPIFQYLQNYRFWCLNGYFFREEKVCEDCLGKTLAIPGIARQCYRNSFGASFSVASMLFVHNMINTWNKTVDAYIASTEFSKQKFIEGKLSSEKVFVKPNFIPDPNVGKGNGNFVLFVGRLSPEKGISFLLQTWKQLGSKITLKIVGDGDLQSEVEQAANETIGIEYLGRQPIDRVYDLMGQAKALIFPSLWYEGLPRTIIESFAKGTPVIASNLGAMSSLIEHQKTGLHFTPRSVEELNQQINWMLNNPLQWQQIRIAARKEFEAKYTAEASYQQLMDIYNKVLAQRVR